MSRLVQRALRQTEAGAFAKKQYDQIARRAVATMKANAKKRRAKC